MKKTMKISTMRLSFLTIGAGFMILFTSCQEEDLQVPQDKNLFDMTSEAGGRAAGPSASGQGTVSLEEVSGIDGEGFRHFTFQARVQRNGNVAGSAVLTYIGGKRNISFDINCLTVNGNHAIMSGVKTRDNQFPESESTGIWFEVFDNGEGAGADQISMAYTTESDCANDFSVPSYEIEGGNIQVRE